MADTKYNTVEEQMATLKAGDAVIKMDYHRYKKHYADCEIVVGSFETLYSWDGRERYVIKVIVRDGRMKASGVRGKEYAYYRFRTADNKTVDIKAVEFENAVKKAPKNSVYEGILIRDLYGAYRFHAE